jgi:hypothetical protein
MKLGEMLIRDGRLTDAQLQAALATQSRDGGRLGTVLFELGMVDLEALTVYLGLELGIPIATGAMLERAKRAAVRMLQPAQAYRYKVVPLVIQDRQLIAAIEDPHDFATLDAMAQATGYRVLPRVCPEVRVYYYIERYYGVARPARFTKFGDTPRGDDQAVDTGLPAPPLPGLPPVPIAPVTAPGPKPRLRTSRIVTAARFDDSEALELDAEDLIDSLDADDTAAAEAKPIAETTRVPIVSGAMPVLTPPPLVESLDAEAALTALATANDRNRIVEVLLGFLQSSFDAGLVFTVRDHMAFGWKATGAVPGHAFVEHLLIPLDPPSILQAAIAQESGVFHGPVTPSTVNTYLFKTIGVTEPHVAIAGAIAIGKRLVNIIYGQRASDLTPLQLEDLTQICTVAAEAYARLIAGRKKK